MLKTTLRRTAVASLCALAAVAAIVAAEIGASVSAQSDEQSGRIVARRLGDGRTEFGWQPTGAARVLPSARYFPANVGHQRWLNSSPVEVDGAEIGRINARLRGDGRIEFAFTPTDGERIAPPARYFPADARIGRWLRSTYIAISAVPAAGFTAVSIGRFHACGLRTSGEIECWGDDEIEYSDGRIDPPAGHFIAVSAGEYHTCAIRENREIACWGTNERYNWESNAYDAYGGQTDPPTGIFIAVSGGDTHNCAIRENGEIVCWGYASRTVFFEGGGAEERPTGQLDPPPGRFTAVNARSDGYTCGVRESGELTCWGEPLDGHGETDAPVGRFTAVSAGPWHVCGLRANREIACWGGNEVGQSTPPPGRFTAVSAAGSRACGLRESGEIECWGDNHFRQTENIPAGRFSAVELGPNDTCAIRESGAIECWGFHEFGQSDAPNP